MLACVYTAAGTKFLSSHSYHSTKRRWILSVTTEHTCKVMYSSSAFRKDINLQIITHKALVFVHMIIQCFTFLLTISQFCENVSPQPRTSTCWLKKELNAVIEKRAVPIAREAPSLHNSHGEAPKRQTHVAHIKAFTSPIISMSCWRFKDFNFKSGS